MIRVNWFASSELCRSLQDGGKTPLTTYYAFPDIHWQKIRTNNPLERDHEKQFAAEPVSIGGFPKSDALLDDRGQPRKAGWSGKGRSCCPDDLRQQSWEAPARSSVGRRRRLLSKAGDRDGERSNRTSGSAGCHMHARDFYILPRSHKKRRAGDSVHHSAIMHDQTGWEHAPYCAVGISCHFERVPLREPTNHDPFARHRWALSKSKWRRAF